VPRYAALLRASANRVYGAVAPSLGMAELDAFAAGPLGGRLQDVGCESIGGVAYLVASSEEGLDERGVRVVGNLSSLHALFEVEADERLRPVPAPAVCHLDEDLVTIQRYVGKTNEAFTHLLVNLALATHRDAFDRVLAGQPVRLLDPMCGRGTTLNRAALYGIDAVGIDVDGRALAAYEAFLTTWLQDKRMKHTVERATHRKGRPAPVRRTAFSYGPKGATVRRTIEVVHADGREAAAHLPARSVDLLVADLPYGVQHGARTGGDLERDPGAVLAEALPAWRALLGPGAAVVLGWNRRTLPRPRLVALAEAAGLRVDRPEDDRLVHRVDRSITRDVVVATPC
jgi:SAM-dependent methyltransferase